MWNDKHKAAGSGRLPPSPAALRVPLLLWHPQLLKYSCRVFLDGTGVTQYTSFVISESPATVVEIMSVVETKTEAEDPLVIRLQNGQTLHVESNEAIDADEIPIINVAGIYSDKLEDRQAVAEKVREAAHRIGFFYVVNHVSIYSTWHFVLLSVKRVSTLALQREYLSRPGVSSHCQWRRKWKSTQTFSQRNT